MIDSFVVAKLKSNNWGEPHDLINKRLEDLSLNDEAIISIIPEKGIKDEYGGSTKAFRVFYRI